MLPTFENIYRDVLNGKSPDVEEGLWLYGHVPLAELMVLAHEIRKKMVPGNEVGWIIDRNVNLTNVCISGCKFCNFSRRPGDPCSYITSRDEYRTKIAEMYRLGGRQLLLQGGMNPELGLDYYTSLFRDLKAEWPDLKLHALGSPEVVHLARMEGLGYSEVLEELRDAGLDSLPGAGAEILVDRVRRIVSPGKCTAGEWLDVMRVAHIMNLPTSATMMFGHIETVRERMEHLVKLRSVQAEKPVSHFGFVTFIPWPFQDEGTVLQKEMGVKNMVTAAEYVRMVALSRIMLTNIPHIQASWLTVGEETARLCLYAGADDLGSVMIEENVVSAAGAHYRMDSTGMREAIIKAGFKPRYRNQKYETEELPSQVQALYP